MVAKVLLCHCQGDLVVTLVVGVGKGITRGFSMLLCSC